MMIPRLLVPVGARPPAAENSSSTRRRPSTLDERTLVPSNLPLLQLDTKSTIPSNLPLDSIAARVVVPRDVNVAAVQQPDQSNLPAQPTDMDERITVPQGATPPQEFSPLPPISEDLVEPDIIQTGEVSFLPPQHVAQQMRGDRTTAFTSAMVHVVFILLLIFEPKIFGPYQRSKEQDEIGRKQITVLLPPGALESLKPSTPPAPHESVRVDPKVLHRIAPPIEPPAPAPVAPQPEPPKRDLPSVPVPQPSIQPQGTMPAPKTDTSRAPLKLESPDVPTPTKGLILPNQSSSPGDVIRDAARSGKMNMPAPVGGGGQLPGGGGGGGGGGRGSAYAGIQMLTDNEGIDFNDYLHRVYVTVKQNWFAVMPASVSLGDQGVVSLRFRIMKNGVVPDGEPQQVFSSGKEPLDRAAYSSIRASTPFQPLPNGFKADYIELQFTYYYNLQPPH